MNLIFQIPLIFLLPEVCCFVKYPVKLLVTFANRNTFNVVTGDLIFFVDCVEEIVLEMRVKDEISPTLRTIVNQFDENNKRPTGFQLPGQNSAEELDADFNCENGADREEYDNGATWSDDHDDQPVIADLGSNDADPSFSSYPQVCHVLTI